MGYTAQGEYALTFHDGEAVRAAATTLKGEAVRTDDEARQIIVEVVHGISGIGTVEFTGLSLTGAAGDKFYLEDYEYLLSALAGRAHGVLDWEGEDGSRWRNRLFRDGRVEEFAGTVAYADDPGDLADADSGSPE